eukprot:SAG22_NODE_178_length_16142_cov_13.187995_2_plen_115_part_00
MGGWVAGWLGAGLVGAAPPLARFAAGCCMAQCASPQSHAVRALQGRPVPDWLARRLADGPPKDVVSTRVQGTGVALEVSPELEGRGIGSLMRNQLDNGGDGGSGEQEPPPAARL